MTYPRFEQKIRDKLIQPNQDQQYGSTYGIVLDYDPNTNRATIGVAHHGSDALGDIFTNVVMPMTSGHQSVSPTPGTQVGVIFKDGNIQSPMVTHFFSHHYQDVHNIRQIRSINAMPRYLYGL